MNSLSSLVFLVAMSTTPASSPAAITPPVGSAERAAILDAAREPAARELGRSVQFVVKDLNTVDGWAFLYATLAEADGQAFSYVGTRFEEAAENGMKSRSYAALLRKREGGWNVTVYSVGPTDVAWQGWAEDYAAPAALFVLSGD